MDLDKGRAASARWRVCADDAGVATPCPTCGAPVSAMQWLLAARSPLTSQCRDCKTALRIERPGRVALIGMVFAVVVGAAALFVAAVLGPASTPLELVGRCAVLVAAAGAGMVLGHVVAWLDVRVIPARGAPWVPHLAACTLTTLLGLAAAWAGLSLGLS